MRTRGQLQYPPRSIAATDLAVITALLLCIAGVRPAFAQSAEAEALFSDGNKLMTDGKLGEACDAFDASNRVEPRAGTLIRLGECREANQQFASAWSAYKDALNRVKDPRKRELATSRAAALVSRLSYLTISVADEARIDGLAILRNGKPLDPMLWNRGLPVDGGDYVIVGSAPGHEDWQTIAHVPASGGKVSVEVPRFKDLAKLVALPSATPLAIALPAPASPPGDDVGAVGFTTRRKVALGLTGAGIAVAITGAVLGASATQQQDDAFRKCPDPATPCAQSSAAQAQLQSARHRALAANIAFGVAASAIVGAGVLWFTGAPEPERGKAISVSPSLSPRDAGLVVRGSF